MKYIRRAIRRHFSADDDVRIALDGLRRRGSNGANDEVHLAAAAQNLRILAKLLPIQVASAA